MSIDLSRLDNLKRDELMVIAQQSGVKVHHKAGEDTIRRAIIDQVMQPKAGAGDEACGREASAACIDNTPQMIEEAIAKQKANPRFSSVYDMEENTWHFRWTYENGRLGCEESGNMAIPLRVIKMKAEKIARGPLILRGHTRDTFDHGNATGPSAYTNIVLA